MGVGERGCLSLGSLDLRNIAIVQFRKRKKTVNCHYQQDPPLQKKFRTKAMKGKRMSGLLFYVMPSWGWECLIKIT